AMAEAAAHFQRGLSQLVILPDNFERQRQELEFYSALGAVFTAAKVTRRRKQGMPIPVPENCGSSWARPLSSFGCTLGSHCITCIAENSIWRWGGRFNLRARFCCKLAGYRQPAAAGTTGARARIRMLQRRFR